jgi:hypothetical protein
LKLEVFPEYGSASAASSGSYAVHPSDDVLADPTVALLHIRHRSLSPAQVQGLSSGCRRPHIRHRSLSPAQVQGLSSGCRATAKIRPFSRDIAVGLLSKANFGQISTTFLPETRRALLPHAVTLLPAIWGQFAVSLPPADRYEACGQPLPQNLETMKVAS